MSYFDECHQSEETFKVQSIIKIQENIYLLKYYTNTLQKCMWSISFKSNYIKKMN
jgi:hypothetical protein